MSIHANGKIRRRQLLSIIAFRLDPRTLPLTFSTKRFKTFTKLVVGGVPGSQQLSDSLPNFLRHVVALYL